MTELTKRRKTASGLWATEPEVEIAAAVVKLEGHFPLRPGDEVTVAGLGRCRYRGEVKYDDAGAVAWLNVYDKNKACRSILPAKITTVHRKEKLR